MTIKNINEAINSLAKLVTQEANRKSFARSGLKVEYLATEKELKECSILRNLVRDLLIINRELAKFS